jgi:hypothetical protein
MKNLHKVLALIFIASFFLLSACGGTTIKENKARAIDPSTESAKICVYNNRIVVWNLPDNNNVTEKEVYAHIPNQQPSKSFSVTTDQGNSYQTEVFSAVPDGNGYTVTGDSHSTVDFLDNITEGDDTKICYTVGPDLNKSE